MNYHFIPTLEHMAAVKIAERLYYDEDIEKKLAAVCFLPRHVCCLDRNYIELWKLIRTKAAEKLPFLPYSIKSKVSKFIRPLHRESVKWMRDHESMIGLSQILRRCPRTPCYSNYRRMLCWKVNGTIDKVQTAKKIAQNRNTDPVTRFVMACTYFLEEEVLALWYGDKEVDWLWQLTSHRTNQAVRFWIKLLEEGSWRNTPWREMVDRYLKIPRIEESDSRLRLSCFFLYLSREGKKNYFSVLNFQNRVHHDDYHLCIQTMDETERMELISVNPSTSLVSCLMWPFQSLFIEMANRSWSYINAEIFLRILLYIIGYIFNDFDDFDYVELLKEFWYKSPASLKNAVENKKTFFMLIELTLRYDEKHAPLSLLETMNEVHRLLTGCKCA